MPSTSSTKNALIGAILGFLAGQDLLTRSEIRAALEQEIDRAGPDALVALKGRLAADTGWGYYPPDPLARRVHHLLAARLLPADSRISGIERLSNLPAGPLAILANHLSYSDANLLEILLQRAGCAELAARLTAVAGPKVFTSRQRRFSSLCFGTVKVPQSADISSEEAVLSARDVARAARRAIEAARERLTAGDALLIFAEGTRSRTGAMQPLLAGAARYLDLPGTVIVPVGLVGTETLFPIGGESITPVRVVIGVGQPIGGEALFARALGNRRIAMDAIGVAIAELLPESYRGHYASQEDHGDARRVLEQSRSAATRRSPTE